MKTQVEATFVGGQFKPDEDVPLAEDTRVKLIIEVLDDNSEDVDEDSVPDPKYHDDPQKSLAAWRAIQERHRQRPIHAGGKRFNRDDLYERR